MLSLEGEGRGKRELSSPGSVRCFSFGFETDSHDDSHDDRNDELVIPFLAEFIPGRGSVR